MRPPRGQFDRQHPRRQPPHRVGDRADVRGRGAAAAADDVDEAALRELAHQPRGLGGRLVVAGVGHRVRQPRVGVARHEAVGHARDLLEVGPHQRRAERAVQAHRQRLRVTHRVPERRRRLTRKRTARRVGDRAGDDDRQPSTGRVERLLEAEQRRLRVQRVEHGFDEQQVGAALDQSERGLAIGGDQLVPGDVARAGIVDVRRDRRGAVGRPERPGDKAWLVRRARGPAVGAAARDRRRGAIHLVHPRGKSVVGLRDRGRVEGVGLDDVGAGFEVGVVDRRDRVGPGQHEEVVVALQVVAVIVQSAGGRAAEVGFGELQLLDHRAHRAVEDEDALAHQAREFVGAVGLHGVACSVGVPATKNPPSGQRDGFADPL